MCSVDGFAWWWGAKKHLNKNLFSNSCADVCKKVYSSPIAAKRSDKVSGSAVTTEGSLTVRPLRFATKTTAGAHSRRERVIEAAAPRNESCQTSGALRWAQQLTDAALIEISKAPASGAAGTRQRGYACKLSIGELPGQRKRYGARGTWVWRALNAINEAFAPLPSNRRPP